MKTLIWLALMALGLFLGEVRACEGPWRFLGRPWWDASAFGDAMPDPEDRSRVLIGTLAAWSIPGTGGVYTCSEEDTAWQYGGLANCAVRKLSYYPYCRPNVFASTDNGLYMRIADTTWIALTSGGGIFQNWGFTICPHDTSVWLRVLRDDMNEGRMMISRNSGQSWTVFYEAPGFGVPLWSRTYEQVSYFMQGHMLARLSIADSTVNMVLSLNASPSLAYHSQQPWIYAGGFDSLGRYDEITGDTLKVPVPPEAMSVVSLAYTEEGLLVSTSHGFFHVSDDLTVWEALHDTVNTSVWILLYTSSDQCLALGFDGLHKASAPNILSPQRSTLGIRALAVYPNPSNGGFVVTYDRPALLQMYDVLGQAVYAQRVQSSGSIWLDLPGLSSGTYFLKATNTTDGREQSPAVKITLVK
ncbi:MAG TPA: T9SS type A sorting domain-containing protein [bacterium]|jgi:hypothetical protein